MYVKNNKGLIAIIIILAILVIALGVYIFKRESIRQWVSKDVQKTTEENNTKYEEDVNKIITLGTGMKRPSQYKPSEQYYIIDNRKYELDTLVNSLKNEELKKEINTFIKESTEKLENKRSDFQQYIEEGNKEREKIERAGTIQPKRINELLNCLEQDTDRMIVIFEDTDQKREIAGSGSELTNTFNHRIILKQYTVNELVEMAKRFARKRQYEVDDDALLELYLKIDKLHNVNDNIKLDDIKEIINQAIVNSERRASRRFFGGLKKKRSENGDVIFLTEADFKDR